jgi:hypothetical protein
MKAKQWKSKKSRIKQKTTRNCDKKQHVCGKNKIQKQKIKNKKSGNNLK